MPSTTSRRAGAKAHRAAAPASAARNCRLRGREKSVIRPRRDEALLGRQRFAGFFAGGQWIRNFRSAVPSVVSGISAARDRAGTTFARSSRPSEFLARSGCTPPAGEEPNDRLSQSGTRSSNPASSSRESANSRSLTKAHADRSRARPPKRLIGYARVSTYGQTLNSQLEQLRAAGCSSRNIYREKVTGAGRPPRA
jgi:hypothetical protein